MKIGLTPTSPPTSDLGLAAYLLYRGAHLEGVQTESRPAMFTLSHKAMERFVNDWHANKPIHFAPKVMFQMRQLLKKHLPPRER